MAYPFPFVAGNILTAAELNALETVDNLGYVSGEYYGTSHGSSTLLSTAVGEDVTFYVPFYVTDTATFDRIAIRTGTSFSGSGIVRMGIYNAGTAGKPTTVVLDAGTVAVTAASTVYAITISQSLNTGWYYLAFNSQTAATTNSYANTTSLVLPFPVQWSTGFVQSPSYTETGVTGAFATAGTVNKTNNSFIILLRKT